MSLEVAQIPFIKDMRQICSSVNNLRIGRLSQHLQHIRNNVIKVARNLQTQRKEKEILQLNKDFFTEILQIPDKCTNLMIGVDKVVTLTHTDKFDLVLRRHSDNIELQSIKKLKTYDMADITKTETNCLHMIFYNNGYSHLKSLAFFERFNDCFKGSNFIIIFNHLVVPLSQKFKCKYIYLEDQSYFFKPTENVPPRRLYLKKNEYDLQDKAFLFNNKKDREEFLLYTRMVFGFRKFETYYQNLLQCYPLYKFVFHAFKDLIDDKPDSIPKIKKVLDTIMTLNRILIEFCVKKLTLQNVFNECSESPKKRKSVDMTESTSDITNSTNTTSGNKRSSRSVGINNMTGPTNSTTSGTRRSSRIRNPNPLYKNPDYETQNSNQKKDNNPIGPSQASTSTSTSTSTSAPSLDQILSHNNSSYNQTIFQFIEHLNNAVKDLTVTDDDYKLANRIFKCLFIYRYNNLFDIPDEEIPIEKIENMLSQQYLDVVLKPFINFSNHLEKGKSFTTSNTSNENSMTVQQNPNQSGTSSSTSLPNANANEQVKIFVRKMFDNSEKELVNKEKILMELQQKEKEDILILLKTVLISWNYYSSTTVKLLI